MTDPHRDSTATMTRFARLWVHSQTVVAAYVYSAILRPEEADDVLQDIAEAAVKSFDRYDESKPFTGWLLGIARHRVVDHLRRKGRDRLVFDDEALDAIAAAHERVEPLADRRRAALERCMTLLAPRQRDAMKLRYTESVSPADIADRLGMKPNAVSVMLHRIRQTLADCIDRRLEADGPELDRRGEVDHA